MAAVLPTPGPDPAVASASEEASPSGAFRSRALKAASSSPAHPRDFLSLSCARPTHPSIPSFSFGGVAFGVVVNTRAGGRHGKVQLWTVVRAALAPPPPPRAH